jgi:hypothetical protein
MGYTEDQGSIARWADETFGAPSSLFRVATRAAEEMAECLRELSFDPFGRAAAMEAADTAIILYRMAALALVNLDQQAAEADMEPLFGVPPARYAAKAARDLGDVLVCCTLEQTAIEKPLGRAYRNLMLACAAMEADIRQEIDIKMVINRRRRWVAAYDGTGRHRRVTA